MLKCWRYSCWSVEVLNEVWSVMRCCEVKRLTCWSVECWSVEVLKRVEGTLHNFSSKQLTQAETETLARGLDYCFYPHRLNLSKIKVEFEKTYSEIKRHLAPKHILDFKIKMLNLYNHYISAFFKQRKHHHANMSKELLQVHNSLRNDNSIIVTKPDKGKWCGRTQSNWLRVKNGRYIEWC